MRTLASLQTLPVEQLVDEILSSVGESRSRKTLLSMTKEQLVNDLYNTQVAEWSDASEDDPTNAPHGKCIPYIGWHWRDTDFVWKCVSIGKAEGYYIGVMENNKWGYPERLMTEEEATTFIGYLDRAFAERKQEPTYRILAELREWMQKLEVNE